MALRTVNAREEIVVLDLAVRSVEPDLDAIRCGDHTLGYIQRAGRVFVSLVGEREDRAEECGQYLLWDVAAARLSSYCPHACD
ncbi:MAG: hypothetical protein ACYCZK_03565 [Microbacteriaceae bacterium]